MTRCGRILVVPLLVLSGWALDADGPPVSAAARAGTLRLTERGFEDDSGLVLPLYAHAGNLLALFTRDPARAAKELDDVATAGYHGVRVWATLGGRYWTGDHVGPDLTPDYFRQVRAFADALRARGLRAVWSQGDVGQLRDRRDYMTRLATLDAGAPFIDFIDCGNEAWHTGEHEPRRLAECVGYYQQAGGRAIRSLTSPPGDRKAELDRYSIPPAQVFDVHSSRDGHSWDMRRRIFSIAYEAKPALRFGIGSEPPGSGALVSITDHKAELDHESIPLLAVTSLYARQAFVWFSGEGVKIRHGLATQAGFWTTPAAVAWLPRDTMTFQTLHHSGDTWRDIRVLAVTGRARVDCRSHADGRFVCTIDGPPGTYAFAVVRAFTARLCHPGEGTCDEVSHGAGETLRVTFTRGRILVGRRH